MMSLHDTTHTDAPGCAVYRACLSISYLCVCVCINLSTYCIDYRISLEGDRRTKWPIHPQHLCHLNFFMSQEKSHKKNNPSREAIKLVAMRQRRPISWVPHSRSMNNKRKITNQTTISTSSRHANGERGQSRERFRLHLWTNREGEGEL